MRKSHLAFNEFREEMRESSDRGGDVDLLHLKGIHRRFRLYLLKRKIEGEVSPKSFKLYLKTHWSFISVMVNLSFAAR